MSYKTIFLPITIITLVFLSGVIHAEPITIAGLNWGMSIDEMKNQLEQDGYVCGDYEITPGASECIMGEKEVKLFPDDERVTFTCAVYNGCKLENKEVAQALVNKGIVDQMEPFNEPIFGSLAYKGRGTDGDLIVTKFTLNQGIIELSKGAYGSGGVEF